MNEEQKAESESGAPSAPSLESRWATPSEIEPRFSSVGQPGVPAPPVDVSIRTLASDLRSLGASGGGLPVARSVALKIQPSSGAGMSDGVTEPGKSAKKVLIWTAIGVVSAAILFFAGYYLYPVFFEQTETLIRPSATTPPNLPAENVPSFFGHESYFVKRSENILTARVGGAAESYNKQLIAAVRGTPGISSFYEVNVQGADGRPLAFIELLSAGGIQIFENSFLSTNFEQDFTGFIYRDPTSGLYPGYILKVKEGQNPILLQPKLLKLERANPTLANFFLASPGSPANFTDGQVNAQPVRVLSFTSANSKLIYGWFYSQYLIISTSEAGLKEALRRL